MAPTAALNCKQNVLSGVLPPTEIIVIIIAAAAVGRLNLLLFIAFNRVHEISAFNLMPSRKFHRT